MTAIMSGYEVTDDHVRKASTYLLVWDDDRFETIEAFGSLASMSDRANTVRESGGLIKGLHHIEVTP